MLKLEGKCKSRLNSNCNLWRGLWKQLSPKRLCRGLVQKTKAVKKKSCSEDKYKNQSCQQTEKRTSTKTVPWGKNMRREEDGYNKQSRQQKCQRMVQKRMVQRMVQKNSATSKRVREKEKNWSETILWAGTLVIQGSLV